MWGDIVFASLPKPSQVHCDSFNAPQASMSDHPNRLANFVEMPFMIGVIGQVFVMWEGQLE